MQHPFCKLPYTRNLRASAQLKKKDAEGKRELAYTEWQDASVHQFLENMNMYEASLNKWNHLPATHFKADRCAEVPSAKWRKTPPFKRASKCPKQLGWRTGTTVCWCVRGNQCTPKSLQHLPEAMQACLPFWTNIHWPLMRSSQWGSQYPVHLE